MELKNKKLLVLGAGRGHLGLMDSARKFGVFTIVATLEGQYPCLELADKVCIADISKPKEVLEIAVKEKIDGIVICCSDTGLPSVGYVNNKLSLSGISEKAASLCKNKYLMKNALVEHRVRTARFYKIKSKEELEVSMRELIFPVVIKSVDLQGSKGIYVANNFSEAFSGFEQVIQTTKEDFCIVEEFIEGWEFGAQAFVFDGQIVFIMPHGDITYMSNTPVPVGHYLPLEIDDALREEIFVQVSKSIYALGLDNCAVNIDFICKDNQVYVIELTGRGGANCLTELVSVNFGIDYYAMIISTALGGDPRTIFRNGYSDSEAVYAKMLMSKESGIVKRIELPDLNDPVLIQFQLFIEEGSSVRSFNNSNDVIGQIIVKGDTKLTCERKIDKILESLKIELF